MVVLSFAVLCCTVIEMRSGQLQSSQLQSSQLQSSQLQSSQLPSAQRRSGRITTVLRGGLALVSSLGTFGYPVFAEAFPVTGMQPREIQPREIQPSEIKPSDLSGRSVNPANHGPHLANQVLQVQGAICRQQWLLAVQQLSSLIADPTIMDDRRSQLVAQRSQLYGYHERRLRFAQIPDCEAVLANGITSTPGLDAPELSPETIPKPLDWALEAQKLQARAHLAQSQVPAPPVVTPLADWRDRNRDRSFRQKRRDCGGQLSRCESGNL